MQLRCHSQILWLFTTRAAVVVFFLILSFKSACTERQTKHLGFQHYVVSQKDQEYGQSEREMTQLTLANCNLYSLIVSYSENFVFLSKLQPWAIIFYVSSFRSDNISAFEFFSSGNMY